MRQILFVLSAVCAATVVACTENADHENADTPDTAIPDDTANDSGIDTGALDTGSIDSGIDASAVDSAVDADADASIDADAADDTADAGPLKTPYVGAPPVMGHLPSGCESTCLVCHQTGIGGAKKTPHPERTVCRSCHLPQYPATPFRGVTNTFKP
jgi:nitrate reductase cytochrome c-type subunit